jgi:hypothetical protein
MAALLSLSSTAWAKVISDDSIARYGWGLMMAGGFLTLILLGLIAYCVSEWVARNRPAR